MKSLPSLAARLALVVTIALGFAPHALAQVPVFEAAAVPASEAATPPATDPAPATTQPAPPATTQPAPVTTPAVGAVPAQPAPARAEQLIEPSQPEIEPANEDDESELESTAKPKRRWYGWQTLTADGISLFTLLAAASVDNSGSEDFSETLVLAGILGYEFAPGIVHFAHRNPGRAFASFGLRLGMPLAGAILGAAAADCSGADCRSRGAGAGFLLGMGGAIALDAAVLAYDNAPPLDRVRAVPVVQVSDQRAWVGLVGEL